MLFDQGEGWVGETETTETEGDGPFTEISWEEDISPITRTCVETSNVRAEVPGKRGRQKWVNKDPFDGNVEVEVEMESNASMAEGSSVRSRPSLASRSTVLHSEENEGDEGHGSLEDGCDTQIHSPEWREREFAQEGGSDYPASADEPVERGVEKKEEVKSVGRKRRTV